MVLFSLFLSIIIGVLSTNNIGVFILFFLFSLLFLIIFSLKKSLVKLIVSMYVFITILIPKAGIKLLGLPITISNILLGIALLTSFIFWLGYKQELKLTSKTDLFITRYLYVSFFYFGMILLLSLFEYDLTSILIKFIPNISPIISLFFIYHFFRDDYEKMNKILITSSLLLVLYGTIQFLFGHYETVIPGITVNYSDYLQGDVFEGKNNVTAVGLKLVSTYQNGNLYGSVLIFISIFVIGLFLIKGHKIKYKPLLLLIGLLAVINLIATLSRSALIGFVLGLLTMSLFIKKIRKYVILITALGIYGIYAFGFDKRIFAKDVTAAGRTIQYENYVNSFLKMDFLEKLRFLFIGKGLGFDYQLYDGYMLSIVESGILNLILYSGIIGLIIYLVPLLYTFIQLIKWKQRDYKFIIAVSLFSSLIGMWGQMTIDQLLNLPPTGQNYWIILSLLLLYIRDKDHSQQQNQMSC